MQANWNRRTFLVGASAAAGAAFFSLPRIARALPEIGNAAAPQDFPRTDPATVAAFVGVAHRDAKEVLRMVERQPTLARAGWDWGYGDWETALGAAAHTGNREIAAILLAHGAAPTLFSAAMLGQLDLVRAIVGGAPGAQRAPGPHGLTLLQHAKAGGRDAEAVVGYLEAVGGADERPAPVALEPADREAVVGRYSFGAAEGEWLDVDVANDRLGIQRPGHSRRGLVHLGGLQFHPVGARAVRIVFAREQGRVRRLTVADPDVLVTARRDV